MGTDDDRANASAPTLDVAQAATLDAAHAPTLAATETPVAARSSLTGEVAASVSDDARYVMGEELGRGGIGRVVLAHDQRLGRDVALKELLASAGSGSGVTVASLARFLREARVTARLEHPGIVPVHELGRRADGSLFYTMKRVRGRSLAQILRAARTPAERLATLSAFRSVCDAVAYAHSRGVVHRDLKPDNVMVGAFGETVVLDWGIAKVRGAPDVAGDAPAPQPDADVGQTVEGAAMGTPSYMAPEQARGAHAEVDERSDVWGLGAILFEILVGAPPFTGTSVMAVLAKVLTDAPPRVAVHAPQAPPELAAIADRALQRDPAARYRSAAELSADVAAFLDGRAVGAYGYSSLELVRRFVRRNRAATIASVLVLVATASAAVYSYARYRGEVVAREEADRRREEADTARAALADEVDETSRALAGALVARAETALDSGDPLVAELFAAAALERARPEGPELPLRGAVTARARSVYLRAREAERWEIAESASFDVGDTSYLPSLAVSADGSRRAWSDPSAAHLVAGDTEVTLSGAHHVVGLVRAGTAWVDSGEPAGVRDFTGALALPLPAPRTTRAMLAADDVVVVATAEGELAWIDATSGSRLATARSAPLLVLAGDRTLTTIAGITADYTLVVVRRAGDRVEPLVERDLGGTYRELAVAPSGAWVAIGGLATEIPLVALPSGELRVMPMHTVGGTVITVSALDDDALLVAGPDVARVFRVADGVTGARVPQVLVRTETAVFARAGDALWAVLAAPALDRTASLVRWRHVAARPSMDRDLGTPVFWIAHEADRILLVTSSTVVAWDRIQGSPLEPRLESPLPLLSVGVSSTLGVVARSRTGAISVTGPSGLRTLREAPERTEGVAAMTVAHDGSVLAAAQGGQLLRCTASGCAPIVPGAHDGMIYDIDVSPDGSLWATASYDRRACIVDAASTSVLGCIEGHERLAGSVAFSPDGRLLATGDGAGWVRIVDVGTREVVRRFRAHSDWINDLRWSADGLLLLAAADDGTSVLSAEDGAVLRAEPTGGVNDALLLDGDRVACVPMAMRVHCFDVQGARAEIDPGSARQQAERALGRRIDGFRLVPLFSPSPGLSPSGSGEGTGQR